MEDGGDRTVFSPLSDSSADGGDTSLKRARASNGYRVLTGPDLRNAIRTALGPADPPKDVLQHLTAECNKLSSKVQRSLNLLDKVEKLRMQVVDLEAGRVPTGVKPHKLTVDVPELDGAVAPELLSFNFSVSEGTTYRQLKERLHYFGVAVSKRVDGELIGLQIGNLRNEIAKDTFVAAVSSKVTSKSTELNDLMQKLSLGTFGEPSEQMALSKHKAERLYLDVMQDIAEFRRKEKERSAERDKSLAKTIEKLKDTKPQDLLTQTIKKSVGEVLKDRGLVKKSSGKANTGGASVDLAHAYTIAASGFDDFENAVEITESTAKKPTKKSKEKEPMKGKGKGKGKGTNKGKDKEKEKEKKSSGFRSTKPKGRQKGQTGKGKDKGKSQGKGKGKGSAGANHQQKGKGKGKRGW